MDKAQNRSKLIAERLFECIHAGEVENAELVQIFEGTADYLGLKTLADYAASEEITYNGAKSRKLQFARAGKVKFVIDND